jgi:glutamate-1-semialdehyde aminotransferase
MGWIAEGKIDQVGTFNGNPLTMAAMVATLTEILTPDAYTEFDRLGEILREGCDGVIAHTGLRAPFAFPDGSVADWVLTPQGWRSRTGTREAPAST